MAEPSSPRLDFEPDIVPSTDDRSTRDEAPALSSLSALARFEFESGQGNLGTKILMVEWTGLDDDVGDWEVSWEGKKTVLSTRASEGGLHRIYFLLGQEISIPKLVKLSQAGGRSIQINPLPAIFPQELGVSATIHGRKGVLHTIWAKKRLSVLQQEIEMEMKNGEGVGLEIAMQEKQWIEENFGVGHRTVPDLQHTTVSPTSPKSPVGGRLSEKLKGLRLGTSAADLTSSSHEGSTSSKHPLNSNPLSPDQGDVAVSSFSMFHDSSRPTRPTRSITQIPPPPLLTQQAGPAQSSRIASLDAMASGQLPIQDETETGDELFAVKLSPRSPEMAKSPFSFSSRDTETR